MYTYVLIRIHETVRQDKIDNFKLQNFEICKLKKSICQRFPER